MAAAISGSTVAADNSPVVNVDNIADNASSASAAISSRGSSWSSAGKGTFVEALFDAFEEYPAGEELSVEFLQDDNNPGMYRLVNPYANWSHVKNGTLPYDTNSDYYIEVNACDPDFVYFTENSPLGVTLENEMVVLHSNCYTWVSIYGEDLAKMYYSNFGGKLSDGVITFDTYTTMGEMYAYLNAINALGTSLPANKSGKLKIVLPQQSSGLAEIEASDNSPVEYFNILGEKVDNPTGGIFIRRQGSDVKKVIIR